MVWENGCVVIVMLTPLVENGVKQCYHYWPDEGSNLYHIYEVNGTLPPRCCRSTRGKDFPPRGKQPVTAACALSAGEPGV